MRRIKKIIKTPFTLFGRFKLSVKKVLKRIFKTRKRFFRITIAFLLISFISFLIVGGILMRKHYPNIYLPITNSEEISVKNLQLNMNSEYPQFVFSSKHIIAFENGELRETQPVHQEGQTDGPSSYPASFPTENRKWIYQSTAQDFVEGDNVVKIYKPKGFYLFQLMSEPQVLEFEVDRVAPVLELIAKDDFAFNSDYKFTVKSETGTVLMEEGQDESLADFAVEAIEVVYPAKDGKNDLKIYSQDRLGNKSEVIDLTFQAIIDDNWEMISCGNFKFPLPKSFDHISVNGGKLTEFKVDDMCDDLYPTLLMINTKTDLDQCDYSGYDFECLDVVRPFFSLNFVESEKSYEDVKDFASKSYGYHNDRSINDYKTLSSIKGEFVDFRWSPFYFNGVGTESSHFLFKIKDSVYHYDLLISDVTPEEAQKFIEVFKRSVQFLTLNDEKN